MGNPVVPVVQYREEYIASFEQDYSLLKQATVRETVIKGNQAVFLVAGSGGLSAVTRGSNGQIPYRTVSNTQNTCTLVEKHAPYEMTGFDIFANQGDQKRIMMKASQAVLHRDMDQIIIDVLDTATQTTGTAVTASLDLIVKARTILGNNEVDLTQEDKIFAVITPAFEGYLLQIKEFGSSDYIEMKPLVGPARRMRRWAGVNWMVHPNLTGGGTSSESCYMWHMDSVGHAANTAEMMVDAGYERKQQVSWTNASLYHGAVLLQNTGIVRMVHDGSAYVSS
jgi:hypothetical protein